MKGLNYKSILTYSYSKSKEEMKRILENDGFKNLQQNDDLKIVEYTIDHSMQIQLSQFVHLQEIKLIRLTIAQNIQLCLDILMKYKKLKEQNIQHNYISSDRILINITDKSQSITILPDNLNYTIHFVGYDCPFYERNDQLKTQKKNDDQSIKEIIINILQSNKKQRLSVKEKPKISGNQKKADQVIITEQKQKEEKQKKFKEKYEDHILIFGSLLDEGIFKSFDNFIEATSLIFEKYKNQNNQNQRLNGVDKQLSKLGKRSRRIDNVKQNLEQIQQSKYQDGCSYEYQQILQLTFPLIAKELITALKYQNQQPPKNDVYINLKQQLQMNDQMIEQTLNENKEEIMKDFKFELDLELIKKDVSSQLINNKLKILNYFLNDVRFSNQNDQNILIQIEKLKKQIVKEVTTQALQNYLELKILQLIDDLI